MQIPGFKIRTTIGEDLFIPYSRLLYVYRLKADASNNARCGIVLEGVDHDIIADIKFDEIQSFSLI